MECPVCGSANVTASHRRGMEKALRYVAPRAPYRCKDCWSRFWRLENPWKTAKAKLGALLAVLLIVGFFSLPFWGPKPSRTGDSAETPEESHTLPVPTHRSAQRIYDPAERPTVSPRPEAASETVSEMRPEVESDAVDDVEPAESTFAQGEPADSAADPGAGEFPSDATPMASAPSEADADPRTASEAPGDAVLPLAVGPAQTDKSAAAPEPAADADPGAGQFPSDATPMASAPSEADADPRTASEAPGDAVLPLAVGPAQTDKSAAAPEPAAAAGPDGRPSADADAAAESPAPEPPVSKSEPTASAETAAVSPEPPSPSASADELPPSPSGPRTLEALAPRSVAGEFELTARAGGPVRQTHIFPLSDPPKLVVDLSGQWDRKVTSPVAVESPLVKRVRLGNHSDYLRLVLDLADAGPLGHEMTPTADGFRLRVFPEGGS
ncbi:MAG: AMIN domain-containing protein [Desulfococcaceae bacterium]